MPGISSATIGPIPLLEGSDHSEQVLEVDGGPLEDPDSLEVIYIDPDYFTTLNQRFVRGRNLDDDVDGWRSPSVGIVNESAMRRFWPDRDPIGRRLSLEFNSRAPVTVVGVVQDSKLMSLQAGNPPAIYLPRSRDPLIMAVRLLAFGSREFLILRTPLDPQALTPLLREAATQEGLSLGDVTAFDDGLRALLMPQRLARLYLILLGVVAVLLTGVGAYGLIAHAVARSEKEIGVRRALGAPAADIVRIVTRRTLWPVIGGAAGGSAFALWAGQFANRFMYGIGEADSATLIVAVAIVLISTVCATAIPVRRALGVNPVETLRAE